MSTATLTAIRPCSRWDPRMWETGNEGNADAIEMCDWCPFKDNCRTENPYPRGVIVAGVAHDDYGNLVTGKARKPEPEPVSARPVSLAEPYRDEILRRHRDGQTWGQIAVVIGLPLSTVRSYGRRLLAQAVAA
ncbi:hypothetical protein ACQEVC_45655 [Plantactinospora sp. CA-294935]|uniref:hypothetical protein n=1 Tax=Plantactinospora sp. CA-294935 TaxID=3240012 RepID=UPI003D922277